MVEQGEPNLASMEQEEAVEELTPLAEAEDAAEMSSESEEQDPSAKLQGDWFVIHSYSGYENKVKRNLEHRIESMGMQHQIYEVVVPTEEEVEIKDGHRRTVRRRVFPGYVLVHMMLTDDSWYVVRNTPGVTGFVGSGNKPSPLLQEEVDKIFKRMEVEAPQIKVSFQPGQTVRIIDGPFADFMGSVDEVDQGRGKVRVLVSFFGRETPVELDFLQVSES
jgi:transcription termination/antitermination protein NusG